MKFRLTRHAQEELLRRRIPRIMLDQVLEQPGQVVAAKGGRKAYQSKLNFSGDKMFLLRAIVDDRTIPHVVVTVYRTSKIDKHWSSQL